MLNLNSITNVKELKHKFFPQELFTDKTSSFCDIHIATVLSQHLLFLKEPRKGY